jgi:probable HAF family extracellular repeat protein
MFIQLQTTTAKEMNMWLKNFFQSLTAISSTRRRPRSARLNFEALEHRDVPTYSVIDLGALGGGVNSYTHANDINAAGQVVGWSNSHAFLWQNGVMTDLGTLGGSYGYAYAINDLGQIVGKASTADGIDHAFLLTPEDTDGNGTPDRWFRDSNGDGRNDLMLDLGPGNVANDVNNVGQVVGNLGAGNAFRWDSGVMTDLGTLGGSTTATAINDAGQVTGSSYRSTGERAGFLWQDDVMHDLGAPPGGFDGASDINQSGQIVGGPFYLGYASLWTPTTPNGTDGSFMSLGALPPDYVGFNETVSTYSIAAGLNDLGAVVGDSYTTHSYADPDGGYYAESARGFVWADGVMQDLSEWGLQHTTAINNAGQIVGNSPDNHAFLLTPQTATTPLMNIGDVTVTEGNTGTRATAFTVTLSAAASQPVTVAYATANGTATAGSDYLATSGSLTFAPGETSKTINVQVIGDRLPEPNETFGVNLSSPTNAIIADGQGTGTILDDEPRISISDVTKYEGKKGQSTQFTFTVALSAAYDQAVTMSFKTTDGTAKTSDNDYVAKTGTLTFAPGQMTKTITITVNGDSKKEADETFYIDLFGLSGNALSTKSRGVGTILNDD